MSLGNRSSLTTDEKRVTTAGTAEQVHIDLAVPDGFEATVTAKHDNTGRVYIGGTKAEAEAHTTSLGPDDVFHQYLTNLSAVWIDVDVGHDGEGVDYEVPQ
ncbi:hypothetical protein ES703_18618 [subsurface metagenome]